MDSQAKRIRANPIPILTCPLANPSTQLLFDWLITLALTLINCDNIILEQSAGSKSGVYVDIYYEPARSPRRWVGNSQFARIRTLNEFARI